MIGCGILVITLRPLSILSLKVLLKEPSASFVILMHSFALMLYAAAFWSSGTLKGVYWSRSCCSSSHSQRLLVYWKNLAHDSYVLTELILRSTGRLLCIERGGRLRKLCGKILLNGRDWWKSPEHSLSAFRDLRIPGGKISDPFMLV